MVPPNNDSKQEATEHSAASIFSREFEHRQASDMEELDRLFQRTIEEERRAQSEEQRNCGIRRNPGAYEGCSVSNPMPVEQCISPLLASNHKTNQNDMMMTLMNQIKPTDLALFNRTPLTSFMSCFTHQQNGSPFNSPLYGGASQAAHPIASALLSNSYHQNHHASLAPQFLFHNLPMSHVISACNNYAKSHTQCPIQATNVAQIANSNVFCPTLCKQSPPYHLSNSSAGNPYQRLNHQQSTTAIRVDTNDQQSDDLPADVAHESDTDCIEPATQLW